jgi:O-antigen/teichoic acid export membrane protein
VKRRYELVLDCPADKDAIEQKWDGFGHHLAGLIHSRTDVIVLTFFAPIVEVSVYSVYSSVISAIKIVVSTFFSNLEAAFGDMIAKGERKVLEKNFKVFEFLSFSLTTVLFTSTALLILPFVSVYTRGISDANYFRPAFAYLITIAEAFSCLRIPYQTVTLAAGHFKQTRNGAFMEAGINVVFSLLLVKPLGMVGVAIGTLCAMVFRTVQYVTYLSKNILERSLWEFIHRFIVYSITSLTIVAVVKFLPLFPSMPHGSYVKWIVYAVAVTLTSIIITITAGVLFYREQINDLLLIGARMLKKGKAKTPGETS